MHTRLIVPTPTVDSALRKTRLRGSRGVDAVAQVKAVSKCVEDARGVAEAAKAGVKRAVDAERSRSQLLK